jgi:hypothetical protein
MRGPVQSAHCTIETQLAVAKHVLKRSDLFYRLGLPTLPHPTKTTDSPRNVGYGQYLTPISVFLLAPAAKIA